MKVIVNSLLILIIFVIGSCKKDKDEKKLLEAAALYTATHQSTTPGYENTCTVLNSAQMYTKEATVKLKINSGSCDVMIKKGTSITQREKVKSSDPRELTVVLGSDGKYLIQFYKTDTKTEPVSELEVIRKTSVDSPKITPNAILNNLTGDYETTLAVLSITVTPSEEIKTLYCNNSDYSDNSLKSGKPTIFTIPIGVSVTLSCIVTDLADNSKPLPNLIVRKISSSAWFQSMLPVNYQESNSESVVSCYKGNLSDLSIEANGIPLAPTTNPDGSICVTVSVPFGSKSTEITVQGTNAANNGYTFTHIITQLKELQKPTISLIDAVTIKVTKNENAVGTTTNVFFEGMFITSFTETEKIISLVGIAPVGISVISAKNDRLGYSSVASYFTFFRTFLATAADVMTFKIDNFLGNFIPTIFDFSEPGLKATTTYGLVSSRSYLRAIFTVSTGFAQSVQLTIRPKSKTNWDTLREGGSFAGQFNTTYVGKYRLYNFVKRSYEEAIVVEGTEKIPVTFNITSENVSNNQVVVLLESGANVQEQTGNYYYVYAQYSDCMEPSYNHRYFYCPYNGGSFRNEDGAFCGAHDAWCYEKQNIVTSNTIELPVSEIGFAVFE